MKVKESSQFLFLLVKVFVRASIAQLLKMSICNRSDARACRISVKGVVIGIVARLTMHHTKQSGDAGKISVCERIRSQSKPATIVKIKEMF
jgi:hypothetical protein